MRSKSVLESGGISRAAPLLSPQQVCFVVDDVRNAIEYCEQHFGWGPFYQFKAPVPEASYKNWQGEKLTEVALGMAGKVQVEFLHVHKGHDTTADYQAQYGCGFQHIGIHCSSRDEALAYLESLGATINELNEYPGIRFAFANVPTGTGMFEILQPTAEMKANADLSASRDTGRQTVFDIDRVSIVTRDIEHALSFYSSAFAWHNTEASSETLLYDGKQSRLRRYIGQAGTMELELIQPLENGDDPYAAHLRRGDHGLIHAGGVIENETPGGDALRGEWLDSGEHFALYDWAGGTRALQIRTIN